MSTEVKLLSDNISELLQQEFMDVEISGIPLDTPSGEDSSGWVSDEPSDDEDTSDNDDDTSDNDKDSPDDSDSIMGDNDLGQMSGEDSLTSNISSDDDGTLSDDEFDTTDSDRGDDTDSDAPPPSFRTHIFNELEQMYAHRYETPHRRLQKPMAPFSRHVLTTLKTSRPDHFRSELRVSPLTFDRLVEAIAADPVFESRSALSHQAPVHEQLAVALYRFGHNGNAASLQSVANWAGIGKGTVELYTHRVMTALLRPEFMGNSVHWPSEEEKEAAKKWVELHSCKAWRNGWCFVDGTLIPLVTRPYWYGESYFDRKCRYSLNIQVCFPISTWVQLRL